MPVVSMFFGIIVRMYYDEHNPPHMHVEYQNRKAVLDFRGNILLGDLGSKTALRLVREWIDLHENELHHNWERAMAGQGLKPIDPLK
jgi:hypothetical protein